MNEPIDVVVAWVDGDDPLIKNKRAKYLHESSVPSRDQSPSQFREVGEIIYCINSIIRFAPFVRNIFLLTDDQTIPNQVDGYSLLPQANSKIKYVSHQEIYRGYEVLLPMFNSISIESLLFRIKGLSEQFVYFNDDFFLVKKIEPSDWFQNGKPVLKGRWQKHPEKIWYKRLKTKLKGPRKNWSYQASQSDAAKIAGCEETYLRVFHAPHPLLKSTQSDFYKERTLLLESQIKPRFREVQQYYPIALANHLEIKAKSVVIRQQIGVKEIHNPGKKSIAKIESTLEKALDDPAILSVNLQNIDQCNHEKQNFIFNWLKTHI